MDEATEYAEEYRRKHVCSAPQGSIHFDVRIYDVQEHPYPGMKKSQNDDDNLPHIFPPMLLNGKRPYADWVPVGFSQSEIMLDTYTYFTSIAPLVVFSDD